MKRKTRTMIGIALILTAVGLMVYWETDGRDRVRTVPLLVAARTLMPGEMVREEMLARRRVDEENRIWGALKPESMSRILGREVLYPIPENSQVAESFFGDGRHRIRDNQGIFLIRRDWIFSVSSSLRKGDRIRIYPLEGQACLGTFQVAFVKDGQGREVLAEEEGRWQDAGSALERTRATGAVDHLEILASMEEYRAILDYLFDGRTPGDEAAGADVSGYQDFSGGRLIIQQAESEEGQREEGRETE